MSYATLVSRTVRRLLPALVVALAACGPFHRGSGPEPATIYFSNESLDQADVYVLTSGGARRRIGTVMAGRTETLTIPTDLLSTGGSLNIVARLLAKSNLPQTGPVSILPGEAYEVRLPSDQRLLSFLPAGP
jgi:hypothetical protein